MLAESTPKGAWPTLFILCALFAISFVDRMVLALVMDPVRAEMGVSDTAMSLLFGLGFVLVYVVAGMPLAHMADKGSRKKILVGGVMLWSVSTFLSGFAPNFWMLVFMRAGVAIGEAVLMPIAMSMIYDFFPKERRTFPVTFYTMTGVIMAPGSFIVGAGALALAEQIVLTTGGSAWRVMFMLVAIPGPFIMLLFHFFGRDPDRRVDPDAVEQTASTRDFLGYLKANRLVYFPMFVGTGCLFMVGMGLGAWTPTMLVREHGMLATSAGITYGLHAMAGGLIGTQLIAYLVRRMGTDGNGRSVFIAAMMITLITIPVLALTIGLSDTQILLIGAAIGGAGIMGATTLVPLLMQQITPRAVLGRTTALYLLFNNMMGMGLGPFVVPVVAQSFAGEAGSIGSSLTLVAWGGFFVAIPCFALALLTVARRAPSVALQQDPAA